MLCQYERGMMPGNGMKAAAKQLLLVSDYIDYGALDAIENNCPWQSNVKFFIVDDNAPEIS